MPFSIKKGTETIYSPLFYFPQISLNFTVFLRLFYFEMAQYYKYTNILLVISYIYNVKKEVE